MSREALLSVEDLSVEFETLRGRVAAVRSVTFELAAGRCLGIVGESGSGKSQTCFAIAGLLPQSARTGGQVRFKGRELLGASRADFDRIRGREIGFIFQDPMTSLTPHRTVGDQLCEMLQHHESIGGAAARQRAIEIMDRVQIPDAEARFSMYPFELSGGMRQRVVIATALILRPALVIADEPTTALDVTVQAEVLRTLRAVVAHAGTALILVTHDLGVVAGSCDEVAVMYAGRIVERAATDSLFRDPQHPYTRALLDCRPTLEQEAGSRLQTIEGVPPSPSSMEVPGCEFAARCPVVMPVCTTARPPLTQRRPGHAAACHQEQSA